jgi:hypothetical protein
MLAALNLFALRVLLPIKAKLDSSGHSDENGPGEPR